MLELLGKKYQHVFTAGEYTQGNVTQDMLYKIASSYNAKFHEAPVFIGHTSYKDSEIGNNEPHSYGWVDSLIVDGNRLYASFSYVSDNLRYLTEEKRFKYCSAEFVYYEINGVKTPYFYALALTNRPAVKGLEPLDFELPEVSEDHVQNNQYTEKLQFTLINNFYKQNQNEMNQYLLKAAAALGLDMTKFTTESSLADAIAATFTEKTSEITTLSTKITDLESRLPAEPASQSPEAQKYTEEIKNLKKQVAVTLADTALASRKITSDQKDSIIAFAEANFEAAKNYVDLLPVNAVFTQSQIKDDPSKTTDLVNLQDEKFKGSDGKTITYEEVLKDSALLKKFNEVEIEALKKNSLTFK